MAKPEDLEPVMVTGEDDDLDGGIHGYSHAYIHTLGYNLPRYSLVHPTGESPGEHVCAGFLRGGL